MIAYKNKLNFLDGVNYTISKNNKKIEYINIPAAFDIETTSTLIDGEKFAFMYVWQIGIGLNKPVIYGRTWEEFLNCLTYISNFFKLSDDRKLIIYVHNLGYEFQFIRKLLNWVDVFSMEERKPLKAVCDLNIEFRCSYILSGYSLLNLAKNLNKHEIKKLVGDLDYSLVRHEKTELTEQELKYCENDILILIAYIDEQIELYKTIDKIPLTNTGRVRQYVKNACYYTHSSHRKSSKSKYLKYRQIMDDLKLSSDAYSMLKRAFMGGFTHANAAKVGRVIDSVTSIDFTSSYPSVMLAEKYPMSEFLPTRIGSVKELKKLSDHKALVMDLKFINIRPKIEQELYISESKTFNLKKPIINNGRIHSAAELCTTLTEIDLLIMEQVYEWDFLEIGKCFSAFKNYLPKSIIESVLKFYVEKTEFKDVVGKEVEYMLSKNMLNSVYGMCVTDIVKDNAIYSGEWETEKVDLNEEIEKYNSSKTRFLYYPWGVWVTAYARKNLFTGIIAGGNDYIYSDTDSIKLTNYSKYSNYINWYNNQIESKINLMADYHKIDKTLLTPKTIKGIEKPLGVWDFDGFYSKFKTLGAKRYMYECDGKIKITVAGLSKQNGVNYLLNKFGEENIFENFNDSLYIPANETGKNTHTYLDSEKTHLIKDYLGNVKEVNSLSSVHLQAADFTLSLSEQFKSFLQNYSKGYLLNGVKYI